MADPSVDGQVPVLRLCLSLATQHGASATSFVPRMVKRGACTLEQYTELTQTAWYNTWECVPYRSA